MYAATFNRKEKTKTVKQIVNPHVLLVRLDH